MLKKKASTGTIDGARYLLAEVRNEGTTNSRPYKESFVYDALGHLTERPINKVWSGQGGAFSPTPQTYVNERNTVWEYDDDGNLTDSGAVDYTIDAAGQTSRTITVTSFPPDGEPVGIYGSMMDMTQTFDGDGLAVKKLGVETLLDSDPEGNVVTTKTFHQVRSSVLGGKVVSEIGVDSDQRSFVYLGGAVLAVQYRTSQTVNWEHRDAGNASVRMTSSDGSVLSGGAELDPLGNDAGPTNTVTPLSPRLWKLTVYPGFGGAGMNGATQCTVDRIMTNCSSAFGYVAAGVGTVQQGPGFYGDYVVINHRETPREGLRNFSQSVNNSSPQNTGFNLGNIPFTGDQRKILASSSNRINQGDCKKFINDTLAKHKVGKEVNSLEKLINRAKLSYYDTSTFLGGPDYSPSQLGLDTHGTLVVRGLFLNGAAAVTAPDRVNVFLSDDVFTRTDYGFYTNTADTSSFIVHELFHVAGIHKSIVDSQQLQDETRKHCGLRGSDRIKLRGH